LEDTPWNATENLSHLNVDDALGREEDCCEGSNQYQASHNGVAISKAFGDITVDEETDNFAAVCAVAETSLPSRRNLPLSIW